MPAYNLGLPSPQRGPLPYSLAPETIGTLIGNDEVTVELECGDFLVPANTVYGATKGEANADAVEFAGTVGCGGPNQWYLFGIPFNEFPYAMSTRWGVLRDYPTNGQGGYTRRRIRNRPSSASDGRTVNTLPGYTYNIPNGSTLYDPNGGRFSLESTARVAISGSRTSPVSVAPTTDAFIFTLSDDAIIQVVLSIITLLLPNGLTVTVDAEGRIVATEGTFVVSSDGSAEITVTSGTVTYIAADGTVTVYTGGTFTAGPGGTINISAASNVTIETITGTVGVKSISGDIIGSLAAGGLMYLVSGTRVTVPNGALIRIISPTEGEVSQSGNATITTANGGGSVVTQSSATVQIIDGGVDITVPATQPSRGNIPVGGLPATTVVPQNATVVYPQAGDIYPEPDDGIVFPIGGTPPGLIVGGDFSGSNVDGEGTLIPPGGTEATATGGYADGPAIISATAIVNSDGSVTVSIQVEQGTPGEPAFPGGVSSVTINIGGEIIVVPAIDNWNTDTSGNLSITIPGSVLGGAEPTPESSDGVEVASTAEDGATVVSSSSFRRPPSPTIRIVYNGSETCTETVYGFATNGGGDNSLYAGVEITRTTSSSVTNGGCAITDESLCSTACGPGLPGATGSRLSTSTSTYAAAGAAGGIITDSATATVINTPPGGEPVTETCSSSQPPFGPGPITPFSNGAGDPEVTSEATGEVTPESNCVAGTAIVAIWTSSLAAVSESPATQWGYASSSMEYTTVNYTIVAENLVPNARYRVRILQSEQDPYEVDNFEDTFEFTALSSTASFPGTLIPEKAKSSIGINGVRIRLA